MNYTVQKLEKSQVKIDCANDKAALDAATNTAYIKNKNKYNVPGFRKGHAPRKVIEGMYGPVFFSDAVNELIDAAIDELSKTGEFEFVSFDSVDDVDVTEDGGVKFSLTMTVYPEVKLGEYKGLGIEKKVEKVTDEQVDAFIANAQQKQVRRVPVEVAENGNVVLIDFVGKKDGVAFDGGSANDFELTLGSNTFIPGFEEQLVGVKAGDVKEVNVTFPKDYFESTLADQPVVFTCTVKDVYKNEIPELNDDFAKEISEFDTFEEYKADVVKTLEHEAEHEAEHQLEEDLLQAIADKTEMDIPNSMVEREIDDIIEDYSEQLQYRGLSIDDYFKHTNTTMEQLRETYKDMAARNIKVRACVEEIVKREEVKVEPEEVDKFIEELADEQAMSAEEYKKTLNQNQIAGIVNHVLFEKLMDLLKKLNLEKPKKTTKKKAAPAEQAVEAPVEETKPVEEAAPAKKPARKKKVEAEGEEKAPAEEKKPAPKKAPAKTAKKTDKAPKDAE